SLATYTGAAMDLVFVQPLTVSSLDADPTFSASLFEQIKDQNLATLKEWAIRYGASATRLRIGMPVDEIVALATDESYDLVACAHTGAGAAEEVIFGSTTKGLVNHSRVPVLVIHPEATWHPFKKILLATDLEHLPEKPPAFLDSWARLSQASITLFYVAGIEEDLPEEKVENAMLWALKHFPGLRVEFRNYYSEDRMLALEETADSLAADLVVVVHKHRNFFERIVHPAFSAKVARNLKRPLLILEI
ncbi:MAG: universal stress protein, partial [Flavobacteriales bacterium]|nr:universal stress protein [Flavobacteriales bacterium]